MTRIDVRGLALAGALAAGLSGSAAGAQEATAPRADNVVLVHGAWADGSSWAKVIPILQAAGLNVTAVQNPLTSVADSAAETRRVLARQEGPTVLVGHSFGGTVISETGDDPKVTALVYVAARAPDAGEDFAALTAQYPQAPVRAGLVEREGFTTLSEEAFISSFANGVPETDARVLYAVQQPTAPTALTDKTTAAAWHDKPTFYAVSTDNRTIQPDVQRVLAKRMGAETMELDAGHLSMISHPEEIAALILEAAGRSD